MRLSIPVGLFERYGRSSALLDGNISIARGQNHSDHKEIPIHVEVDLNMTTSISAVSSPSSTQSFRMKFEQGNRSAKVNAVLTSSAGDFAVIVEMTENIKSMIYVEAVEETVAAGEEEVFVVSDKTVIATMSSSTASQGTQETVIPDLSEVAINPSIPSLSSTTPASNVESKEESEEELTAAITEDPVHPEQKRSVQETTSNGNASYLSRVE